MQAHIDSPASIGQVVRLLRVQHGMSQRQLAEALGTTQRYITEIETGRPKRLDQNYLDLLRRLGITMTLEIDDRG